MPDHAVASMSDPSAVSLAPTVAFVTYNSAGYIGAAIRSVRDGTSRACRIVVVDNASLDDTVAVAEAAGAEVLRAANLGYSAGINRARAHVGPGSPLLIANPDLAFGSGAVDRLLAALEEPGVGVAVPKLLDEDGGVARHLHSGPSVLGALGDALFGSRWPRRPRWLSDHLLRPEDYESDRDVDWGGGAAVMIAPACDQAVGEWDAARYFLYAEETDYQLRARRAGFGIRYVAAAEAVHVGGASGQSPALEALMAVNRIRCFRAFHGRVPAALFRGAVALEHLLRARTAWHRMVLRTVLDERSWARLPRGDRPTA